MKAATLEAVAKEYPDLDKSNFGYDVRFEEGMLASYAASVVEFAGSFHLIQKLCAYTDLLTPESVLACEEDEYTDLVKGIAELGQEEEEEDLEGDETDEGETAQQSTVPGQQQFGDEEGSNDKTIYMTPYLEEIRHLKRIIDSKDTEIANMQGLLTNISNESDVKYEAMRTQNDGLEARYVDMKDRRDRPKGKLQVVRQEHREYERVLNEVGFATISELEVEALRIVGRCIKHQER